MKKKLFMIFGPIILAFGLFGLCLSLPGNESPKTLHEASQSLNMNVISGEHIKNKALAEKQYVPFFGSSELNRFDPFHPSVLAAKYDRPYTPFLLGAAGTQSLKQFMITSSMGKDLRHKKAVFIISPQWFVPKGVKQQYFDHWYSGVQMYSWLNKVKAKRNFSEEDRYFAKRLQQYNVINENPKVMGILNAIVANQVLTKAQQASIERNYNFLMKEDRLFGSLGITAKNLKRIQKNEKKLPDTYDYNELNHLAYEIGKKSTTSNNLQISNSFYNGRLRVVIGSLKDKDLHTNYLKSPEYSDFELVLNVFAKNKTDVLFIIPPVNHRWVEYTGMSQAMLTKFGEKITHQLKSQGFNNVLNLINNKDNYFMTDTIHIGWRGWLYCDRYIRPFLESPYTTPNYHINDYYYTEKWQKALTW